MKIYKVDNQYYRCDQVKFIIPMSVGGGKTWFREMFKGEEDSPIKEAWFDNGYTTHSIIILDMKYIDRYEFKTPLTNILYGISSENSGLQDD